MCTFVSTPTNPLSHRKLTGAVPCRPLSEYLLVAVGTCASLVLRDPAEDSQSVEDIKRERKGCGSHIRAGIKGSTVGARVAEEIGHSQNSASFLKLSQDKPFVSVMSRNSLLKELR